MNDTHVIRVHFTNGTSAIDGTIEGGAPTLVDDNFAAALDAGWRLGEGTVLPDGRVVARCSAELAGEAVTGVRGRSVAAEEKVA